MEATAHIVKEDHWISGVFTFSVVSSVPWLTMEDLAYHTVDERLLLVFKRFWTVPVHIKKVMRCHKNNMK